ncbi:HupE/UreJ family protein [Erythrobacter sp. R86502]|uniref:HupE/UreJ family protein n=1 Tax=Erythrobacter sp. R86502 TaxID=3093846 RepID=UPI0036D245A9
MARTRLIRFFVAWLLTVVALTGMATAHQAPNSEAYLDFHADRVELELVIPAAEYAYASGNRVANEDAAKAQARRYLGETISARGSGGAWQMQVNSLDFVSRDGDDDLVATLSLVPQDLSELGGFMLEWRAVIAAAPDHFVLVMLRRDPASKLGDAPDVIGTLRGNRNALAINRGAARSWMPFANAVSLGANHILGGLDHLAFLLALLLPLPLLARGGRWRGARRARPTIRSAAVLISGFTLGHSATLIMASLGGMTLPGALVETLIAVSVLIAAIHAIRPIFPRREALFATLFGLIHGLGFAGFLSLTDLSVARNITTLLGFNIGIELVQIAIALAIVPALVTIAATPAYQRLRSALAMFCCIIAAIWVADRYVGLDERFVTPFEAVVETSMMLVFAAVLTTGVALFARRIGALKPRSA